MDLQAILDASDSSDDDYNSHGVVAAVLAGSEDSSKGVGIPSSFTDASKSVDLEQILREDDDDDCQNQHSRGWDSKIALSSTGGNVYSSSNGVIGNQSTNSNSLSSSSNNNNSMIRSSFTPQTSGPITSSHPPEDWDVLQAILGEDDDDDEETDGVDIEVEEEWIKAAASGAVGSTSSYQHLHGFRAPPLSLNHTSGRVNVDAILQSDEEDDDLDDTNASQVMMMMGGGGLAINTNTIPNGTTLSGASPGMTNTGITPWTESPASSLHPTNATVRSEQPVTNCDGRAMIEAVNVGGATCDFDSFFPCQPTPADLESTSLKHLPSSSSNKVKLQQHYQLHGPTPIRTHHMHAEDINGSNDGIGSVDDEQGAESSQRALASAQAYERKLLRSGHRDIVSPLMVKRRLKPKIELGTRMQQKQEKQLKQKQQNKAIAPLSDRIVLSSTPTSAPRFGFSGVVENKTMPSISEALTKNFMKTNKKGETISDLPTALAVNSRFIAVGTQRGIIMVFDLFEVLRQRLGSVLNSDSGFNPRTAGSVTSIDLSLLNGEVLAAGYTSGMLVLWDTIKGVVLRTVAETHPSPITSVRFLSDLKMVTVDAGGLVNKLTFSKNILWSTYSVETECLLDGTAGQILAMNVLAPYSSIRQQLPASTNPSLKRLVLIALSSERSSFAVAVEPSVHVLHRWARPPTERMKPENSVAIDMHESQVYLPCLSWGWALVCGGGHVITPILARAWGCCVQLLRASYPTIDEIGASQDSMELFQWPAFGIHDEFEVTAPVVALEWLSDRSLVYLTVTNEFTVIDTVMMTLLERLDFSGLQLVYAEFSLSRSSSTSSTKEPAANSESSFCTTFQNSVRSCDNRLLVLCQKEVKSVSIVGAKRRISGLEQDGEWLEALALALDHFENTIKSQEDRKRDPDGRKDLSKHPEFNSPSKSEDEEWIAKLLIRYLNIAVENAPEASCSSMDLGSTTEGRHTHIDLAQSHFQMLAGVCVEFCVVTRRLDLLFGPIFRRFHSVGYLSVFLDVLEPYILNDKLDYIAPEAMAHFVEHCRAANGITTVERCLLHMDVTIMDFDSILTLLRANEMYSALFYVFNQGLDDFTTPLEILLEKIFDAADAGHVTSARRLDGVPQNDFERYGYKAILYLQSCFRGKTFPQDTDLQPDERVHTLRPKLLRFLLKERFSPSRNIKKTTDQVIGQRALRYPYTHILLMVDPRAMFDTISIALDAPDTEFGSADSNFESIGGWEVEVGEDMGETGSRSIAGDSNGSDPRRFPDRQQIITMFLSIMLPEKDDSSTIHQTTLYKSRAAVNAFLDFLAVYLMKGVVRANKSVTFMILSRMAERYAAAKDPQERQNSQGEIIQLLTALPRNSYETDEVLDLVESSGIHRAALLLHQEGASSWHEGIDDIERRAQHFSCAIDCYLEDDDHEFRKEVFAYLKKECSGVTNETVASSNGSGRIDSNVSEPNSMRNALAAKLADLVHLDSLMTAELVAELFVEDLDQVVVSLEADEDGEAQFMFLQTIISGDLNQMDPVAGAVLNAHLTMEHHHQYLALMAQLHPELVYEYLSSHDNYRPEECLKLCQKHDIADASAYLLERMGNVSNALQLILQTLESRMMGLKRTIRGMGTDFFRQHSVRAFASRRWKKRDASSSELYDKQEKEVEGVKRILIVALDLCERNSGTFSNRTEQGSQLWFNVLDRLINAKGFLRLSKEQPGHAKVMAGVLSELLRLTMQRMVSNVPLTDLVRKVTSDNSGSRIGELREMIESLLSTYGLELNVFRGAVNVFHHDAQHMQRTQRGLRVQGACVRAVMNVPLDKQSVANEQYKESLEGAIHRGDALQLADTGNANVLDFTGRSTKSRQTDTGLGNALARMRARRRGTARSGDGLHNSNVTRPGARSTTGLNLMTVTDQLYLHGEPAPDASYFEDRLVGGLGEAEHRGRLMSFMY